MPICLCTPVSYTHLSCMPYFTGKGLCARCYIPGRIYGSCHCIRRICRNLTWKRPEAVSYTHLDVYKRQTYLFDMTIAENIGIAKPGASMEEIKDAAKRAGIAEFIHTLPDGYDTDMGQMSARLSGGERQRIGIARILLRNPDICLMDEPSSALDALHEKELLRCV